MEFFGILLTSLFANNLAFTGHAVKQSLELGQNKSKYKWVLFVLFFVESILLGIFAYLMRDVVADSVMWKYLSIFLYVVFLGILDGVFYLISHKFPVAVQDGIKDSFLEIGLNSALMALAATLVSLTDTNFGWAFVTMLFLPLGYIASSYIFAALYERIELSNAPKGFKGMPLVLLSIAGLALGLTMLSF